MDDVMPLTACTCDCEECMENKNCEKCLHANGDVCDCEGCMCNMDKPEPPMAM